MTNTNTKKDFTSISYGLKNILVAGQCFQSSDNSKRQALPPNGLQLTLAPASSLFASSDNTCNNSTVDLVDTLVMQNLGYFQLQANPGLYVLNLAEGKASNLYTINDAQVFGGKLIVVKTFGDSINRLSVKKVI